MELCALAAVRYDTHGGYTVQFDVLSDHTDLYKILVCLLYFVQSVFLFYE